MKKMKKMVIECCMGSHKIIACKQKVVYRDTKTKEFLCEEHGKINLEIYRERGEEPKMEMVQIEENLFFKNEM